MRTFWLQFDKKIAGGVEQLKSLRSNLSAIEMHDDTLWIASDERCFLERLSPSDDGATYSNHRRYSLAGPFALQSSDTEVDLEGLSRDGRRLWLMGSHCLTRKRPRCGDPKTAQDAFDWLEDMKIRSRRKSRDRCLLGFIDLSREPEAHGAEFDANAVAAVAFTDEGSALVDLLAADEQLAPFTELPAKENGLDFEGLAVRGKTVFIGLRGPVLRGLAIVIELRVQIDAQARSVKLRKLADGRRYAKHAFDLQGLGVRDLAFRGERLLILAAPTMAVDGVAAVFEWEVGGRAEGGGLACPDTYGTLLRLPGGNRGDYAEGVAYLKGEDAIAVVVDQPLVQRLDGHGRFRVDVFSLGDR